MDTISLQQFITSTFPFKEEEMEHFLSGWQPLECKRKTILTAAGETERYLYFVLEGVQRGFYIGNGKQEATIVFTYPPSFSGLADSFLTQTPSKYFLETLTYSRFLRKTYKEIESLMNEYPNIQRMVLQLTGFVLKGVLERQIELAMFQCGRKIQNIAQAQPACASNDSA